MTEQQQPVELLHVVVERHIRRVLHRCRGNRSEAARRLGVHRRSLQRWLSGKAPTKMATSDVRER